MLVTIVSADAPVASFTTITPAGDYPAFLVKCTDTSSNNPDSWNWTFTDISGNNTQISFSTIQNPYIVLGSNGNYLIQLNSSNTDGYDISDPLFFNINDCNGNLCNVRVYTAYDGAVVNENQGTWSSLRDAASGTGTWTDSYNPLQAAASPTENEYINMTKTLTTFDTSGIASASTVTGVNATFWGYLKANALGSPNVSLIDADPSNPWGYAASDWSRTSYTRQADDISYENWAGGGKNTFYNVSPSSVSKGENTVLGTAFNWTVENQAPWSSGSDALIYVCSINAPPGDPCYGNLAYLDIAYDSTPVVAPVSAFSGDPVSGTAPLAVTFTDQSTNTPTSWRWAYRNGSVGWTQFNTSQNPVMTFAGVGTYDINLTATNAGESDDEIKSGYITVSPAVTAPVAAFSGAPRYGDIPLSVTFTDASTNTPTNWNWYFGNGTKFSDEQNPKVSISPDKKYDINLYVSNAGGGDWENKSGYIQVNPVGSNFNSWSEVSGSILGQQSIISLVRYNEGTGEAIFGGTQWGALLFKYNRTLGGWSQVAGQINSQNYIHSLVTYNDGTGEAIFGGTGNGGRLFKYNTTTSGWVQVADALSAQTDILSLVTYDDGTGTAIFGSTSDMDNGNGARLYKYNTTLGGWSQVAAQIETLTEVRSLTVYDDGTGTAIFGGTQYGARLYKYNTTLGGWSQVAAAYGSEQAVNSLVTYDDGTGTAIYGGTGWTWGDSAIGGHLLKYNATLGAWVQVADQFNRQENINSLVVYNDGSGAAIFGGVRNATTGGQLYKYNTTLGGWSQVASQLNSQDWVASLIPYNDGTGTAIYGGMGRGGRLFKAVWTSPTVAAFSGTPTTGTAPLEVTFTDQSTNTPTSWRWAYRNGTVGWTQFSTAQNPSFTFPAGTYDINLTAGNSAGSNDELIPSYIAVSTVLPLPGQTNPPIDVNTDGLYEDMNGNGGLDFNDVQLFFQQMDWIASNEPVPLFDFNANGEIDFNDIQLLFRRI